MLVGASGEHDGCGFPAVGKYVGFGALVVYIGSSV